MNINILLLMLLNVHKCFGNEGVVLYVLGVMVTVSTSKKM